MKRYPLEKKIEVRKKDGTKMNGTLIEYNDEGLVFQSKRDLIQIPYSEIHKILPHYTAKPLLIIGIILGGAWLCGQLYFGN